MATKETTIRMGIWRDAYGQKYKAPVGTFHVGQFSDTGSQLLRVI